jgi:hypothetical protein
MKVFFILAVAAFLITSCHHVYYAPNTVAVPLLAEKHDVRINGLYSTGGESEFSGAELQFAYAPSKHFGVMFNAMAVGQKENTGDYLESGNGRYGEFAAGYFNRFELKWIFETYAGFGGGKVNNEYGMGDHSTIGMTKFFIQPAIAFKSRYFEMAFAPRFGIVNWKEKESSVKYFENDYAHYDLMAIRAKPSFFTFEPAIILRGGGEHVKIQFGLSFSNPGQLVYTDLTESMTMGLGLSVHFNTRKNNRQ